MNTNAKSQSQDSHMEETLKALRGRVSHLQEVASLLRSRLTEVISDEVPQNPPPPVPGVIGGYICPLSRSISQEIDLLDNVIETLENVLHRLCV